MNSVNLGLAPSSLALYERVGDFNCFGFMHRPDTVLHIALNHSCAVVLVPSMCKNKLIIKGEVSTLSIKHDYFILLKWP